MKTQVTQRVLSIMLAVSLVASLQLAAVPFALADESTEVDPAVLTTGSGESVESEDSGESVELEAIEIYIDSSRGTDTNSGSAEEPLKTFAAAKALAETDENITTIYVANTITASGEMSLPEGVVLKRAPDFSGNLIRVPAEQLLTLSNITIDGDKAQTDSSSLIDVYGSLIINDGTTIQNNKTSRYYSYGAVYIEASGSATMNGGLITENQACLGAGVCVHGTFTMNGGTIENNRAICTGNDWDRAAGGGVCIPYTGTMYMNGGTISKNKSGYFGGGISLGLNSVSIAAPKLYMTGGFIQENTSYNCGGGLFVQCRAVAEISGGEFAKNISQSGTFGGGAMYVNGGYENWAGDSFVNGEIYLSNVLITDNVSGYGLGGGIASCPTSLSAIQINDGGYIANNGKSDIHINNSVYPVYGTTKAAFYIASHALGGGSYNWKYADGKNAGEPFVNADRSSSIPRWTNFSIFSEPEEGAYEAAQALASVFIHDNHANTRGGGIGSNGDVYIGTGDTFSGKLRVSKTVASSNPSYQKQEFTFKVTLDQYIKDGIYGATDDNPGMEFKDSVATFTLKHGESIFATDLPDGAKFKVEEETPEGFTVVSTGETGQFLNPNNVYEASFTNTPIMRDVLISKVVAGGGEELQGATLTITGADKDGNAIEPISWTSTGVAHTVSLPAGTYTLTEDQAPLGYEIAESITFVVEIAEAGTLVVTIDGEDVSGKVVMEDAPVVPEEPEEPEPVEPSEPEKPEPVEPTEPEEPEPVEPVEPVEPEKPEPAKPVEPAEPTEPAEPETPEPPEPQTPEEPEEPVTPEEPETPLNPPANPEEPAVPEEPVTYKVTINKVDDEGNPVAGVWFGIEKKLYGPDGAMYIPVGPTDENGIAVFEDYLPEAEYVIYEVEAPEGYIMDETVYDVVFDEDGSFTLQVVNKKKPEETIEIDKPETPMNPSIPEEPAEPEQPATPEQPEVPAKPTTPAKPVTPVVANPTPSTTPRVVSGPATADAVSLLSFAGLAGLALVGAVGMFASRKKKHN